MQGFSFRDTLPPKDGCVIDSGNFFGAPRGKEPHSSAG